jgi:tetratricopeptide (TPR) repeat protein
VEAVDGAAACGLAIELWQDGRHEAALAGLAEAAAREPLQPQVHYLCALILLDCGRGAEALAAFRRCTYADPSFAPAYLGQAGLLAGLGEYRRAGVAVEQASRLVAGRDPDEPIVAGADLWVAEARELVASQRRLLADQHAAGRAL